MKFQNPSLNFLNGWMDAHTHTHTHTHGQAETNMLPGFFKVGGIKNFRPQFQVKMVFCWTSPAEKMQVSDRTWN